MPTGRQPENSLPPLTGRDPRERSSAAPYTSAMSSRKPKRFLNQIENELLGEKVDPEPIPRARPVRRPASRGSRFLGPDEDASPLERALGPSCLISLVIVALLLVAFRRLFSAPPLMLALIAFAVFVVILFVLLRMKPLRIDNNDPHDR